MGLLNIYGSRNNPIPADYYDGVEWDPTAPGVSLARVGNTAYTTNHPIHRACVPVLLLDNGNENGQLASWDNPLITGATDGSQGQAMLRVSKFYYKERLTAGELSGLYVSDYALPGFKLHEKFSWGNGRNEIYLPLYDGSLINGKLSSVSGVIPTAARTMAQYRADALARGPQWHDYDYYSQHLIQLLFYVYYANLNSQFVLPGYTERSAWNAAHVRNTGRSNILSTVNGYVNSLESGIDADLVGGWSGASRVIANRFMWMENFYGSQWKFINGCAFDGRIGQPNTAFLTPDPTKFSSVDASILANYTNMFVDIPAAVNENYLQSMGSLFLPKKHGGSSSTYTCDYFWSYLDDATRNYLRVVLVSGDLNSSGRAGVAARYSDYGLGYAISSVVSRVCFEKN